MDCVGLLGRGSVKKSIIKELPQYPQLSAPRKCGAMQRLPFPEGQKQELVQPLGCFEALVSKVGAVLMFRVGKRHIFCCTVTNYSGFCVEDAVYTRRNRSTY